MSIFQTNISILNKFPGNFAPCFSKKPLAVFTLVMYAMFKDYKRTSLEAMAKATHTDYQRFQYFFSDSKLGYAPYQTKTTGNHSETKNNCIHEIRYSCDR